MKNFPKKEGSGFWVIPLDADSPESNRLRKVIPAPDGWAVATFFRAVARDRVLEILSQTAGDSFLNRPPISKANSLLRAQSVTSYS